MAGKTKFERDPSRKLSAMLSVPMEPWAMKRLDDMARRQNTTRAEMVRGYIMAQVDPQPVEEALAS